MKRNATSFTQPRSLIRFPFSADLNWLKGAACRFFLTPFLHLGDPLNRSDRTRKQYTAAHLRWLLRQADRVFVQTKLERDAIRQMGIADERIVLQGLGVNTSECSGGDRDLARTQWHIPEGEVVVGQLANQSVEKGTVDLLQAAARLWSRGLNFTVVLAGPQMSNFRDFWRTFEFQERVVQLGVLTEEQKRNFFAGIDCFALPSRSDSFGLVLLEAWANAKPNLVYRAGGPGEIVRDGEDGLVASCGNIVELAEKMAILLENEQLRNRMGKAGRVQLSEKFNWEDKLEIVWKAAHNLTSSSR